jgi:MoxR-like ATPase
MATAFRESAITNGNGNPYMPELDKQSVKNTLESVRSEVMRVSVVSREDLLIVAASLAVGGHVLFDSDPGTGKTVTATTLATAIGGTFGRSQGTPDLMPGDVSGSLFFNQKTSEFEFHKGPIHSNVFLFDDLSRAQAKTQSAMIEPMQENQITISGPGGGTIKLPKPFFVMGTQNEADIAEGTSKLPKANRDRFWVGLKMSQTPEAQLQVMDRHENKPVAKKVVEHIEIFQTMPAFIRNKVQIDADNKFGIIKTHENIRASSYFDAEESQMSGNRNNLMVMDIAKALAIQHDRETVEDEDIKHAMVAVLGHRLELTNKALQDGVTQESLIDNSLAL